MSATFKVARCGEPIFELKNGVFYLILIYVKMLPTHHCP